MCPADSSRKSRTHYEDAKGQYRWEESGNVGEGESTRNQRKRIVSSLPKGVQQFLYVTQIHFMKTRWVKINERKVVIRVKKQASIIKKSRRYNHFPLFL